MTLRHSESWQSCRAIRGGEALLKCDDLNLSFNYERKRETSGFAKGSCTPSACMGFLFGVQLCQMSDFSHGVTQTVPVGTSVHYRYK